MAKFTAIERTINTIKIHWRDGKTLKEIAGRHRVDAGNLERAFHRREGVTIKQFIDVRRKDYLLSRLGDSALYGHEIGTQMGFSSKRAFYRWVRRAFGISFTALRARFLTRLQQNEMTRNRHFFRLSPAREKLIFDAP